jgi:hypothetical protein
MQISAKLAKEQHYAICATCWFPVIFCTVFLMTGITARLIGNPTTKPTRNPPANLRGNPRSNPVIRAVIEKVIAKSIVRVMNNANRIVEYFLLTFTFRILRLRLAYSLYRHLTLQNLSDRPIHTDTRQLFYSTLPIIL